MKKYCNIGSIGVGNKFIAAGKVGYVIANKANCVRVIYNGERVNFEYMNMVQIVAGSDLINNITLNVVNNFGCPDCFIDGESFLTVYKYPVNLWDEIRAIVANLSIGETTIIDDIEVIRVETDLTPCMGDFDVNGDTI